MPKKLLLADDSVTIQRVIELTFAGEDVQVLTAGDGEEAIARIPAEKPDIILADIGMPKRSGYDVSAFVKGRPELAHIPVLLLAGAFEPVDEAKAKEVQCNGVLVKPFEPQHVIARVRELIGGATGTPTQAVPDIPRPAAVLAPHRPVELARREERQPIPDDLMDVGEEDLLPREDLLPQVEDMEEASQPIVLDDTLDDYFDKLDEAFSTINSPAPASAARADAPPPRPDRPVLERDLESFDEGPMFDMPPPVRQPDVERPRLDAVPDPFAGIDAIPTDEAARVPTLDDLLAGMPPAPEPAAIDFPAPPQPAAVPPPVTIVPPPPPIEPPDVTATLAPAPSRVEWPAPSRVAGPAGDTHSHRSVIADAFSALLAAEQGEPGATPPRLPSNGSQGAVNDSMIDEVARRVIERLALGTSEQMQSMVKEIVSSVAERLVREEIDRIRRNVPRS